MSTSVLPRSPAPGPGKGRGREKNALLAPKLSMADLQAGSGPFLGGFAPSALPSPGRAIADAPGRGPGRVGPGDRNGRRA